MEMVNNSVVIVRSRGHVGMWSKHPLPGHVVDVAGPTGFPDRQFFEAGNRSPVFESPVGGIGKIVCYDVFSSWRSPRLFALKRVDLLVAISGSPTFEQPIFEPLVHAPAMENAPLVRLLQRGPHGSRHRRRRRESDHWSGGLRHEGPGAPVVCQAPYHEDVPVCGTVDYELTLWFLSLFANR